MKGKNLKNDNRGSALILTMVVLANALLIVTAITAISVMERKMSSQSKNSAPAFQSADSGLEWAMEVINQTTDMTTSISSAFGTVDSSSGKINCPSSISDNCYIYLLKSDETVMTSGNLGSVAYVRSIGTSGAGSDIVVRAVQLAITSY